MQAARRHSESLALSRPRRVAIFHWLLLAAFVAAGVSFTVGAVFRERVPAYAPTEFIAHVGAVAAAVRTWHTTHGLPISSDEIFTDVEYPYILLGNTAFYLLSAFVSVVLNVPAYLGAGLTLGAGFALATCGIFLLATRAGLNAYLSVALGFLYAAGPYLSLNLFVRHAFPEYLTWQVVPALLLVVQWALRPRAGPLAVLAGALALAAPFYLHKLLAPHVALTLALMGLNAAPWRAATVFRLALAGALGLLFSVPGLYPAVRGLGDDTIRNLGGGGVPGILHPSLANLFWPYAVTTLPAHEYDGRFTLQAGLVSLVGFAVALGTLLSQPRLAWTRRLALPLVLFVVNVALIMGWFRVWEVAPSPLKYVQFSYRLIGLVHLLGFVLFIQALGSPEHAIRRAPVPMQRLAAVLFVALAGLGAATYWHKPPLTPIRSAEIRPRQLGQVDRCTLCRPTPWSSLATQLAIWPDRALRVPPAPIPVPVDAGLSNIVLSGSVPRLVFEESSEALVIRIYGFARAGPEAKLEQVYGMLGGNVTDQSSVARIGALYDRTRRDLAGGGASETSAILWPGSEWTVRPLGEASAVRAGRLYVHVALDESIAAIAVECSRAVMSNRGLAPQAPARMRCFDLDALAPPNKGDAFVVPRDIPRDTWTRGAMGRIQIDARTLRAGHYALPTFDYAFVHVTDSEGLPVSTYHFDRRPVFEHTGSSTSYTVSYDFQPELLAILAGGLLFLVSALVMQPWRPRIGRVARRATAEVHSAVSRRSRGPRLEAG